MGRSDGLIENRREHAGNGQEEQRTMARELAISREERVKER